VAKILVVDAEADRRELIVFALRFAGHVMSQASNFEECISQTQQNKPELILLDDELSGISVNKLSEALKSSGETAEFPLVLLSSAEIEESMHTGKYAKVEDTIRKSLSPDQMTDKVNSLIKKNLAL
jgi:two-component system response regulator MtrA